jgi:hypothetical protein
LTQAYKNVFPNMTSASNPAATTLSSSLSIYIFLLSITTLFLMACFVNSSLEVTFRIALVK